MPVNRHSGGQETSHDIGEKYRKLVAEYYRAKGYIIERQSNHHATTEDIAAVSVSEEYEVVSGGKEVPSREYFKEVRIEAKAGNLSRLDKRFITELLRVFIDYQKWKEADRWFEYHIFTSDLQASNDWERVFDREGHADKGIKDYYNETIERHKLNDEEVEIFTSYGFEEFKEFLTDVFVHEAEKPRLREMVEDERKIDRSKWDYYTREFRAYDQAETLIPNFFQITDLPNSVWIADCHIDHYSELFEENPRHLPIYYEEGKLYSLLPKSQMSASLLRLIDTDSITQEDFEDWKKDVPQFVVKNLLTRAINKKAVEKYDSCRIVRHNYDNILIFQHHDIDDENEDESVQIELDDVLTGDEDESAASAEDPLSNISTDEETSEPSSTKIEDRKVAMEWGTTIAHRYGLPEIKKYENQFYVFIETGWVFSEHGLGNRLINGDRAHELHTQLQKRQYHNPNNKKAQLRQWKKYLELEAPDNKQQRFSEQDQQSMAFAPIEDLSLTERPPNTSSEHEAIKDRLNTY
jgi:hypothetical protein